MLRAPRSTIAVTAYYAGFLQNGWHECTPGSIHSLAELSPISQARPSLDTVVQRIIDQLGETGIYGNGLLQFPAERVAIVFSASKSRPYVRENYPSTCAWPAELLARKLGALGPSLAPVSACASGAQALAVGAQLIQDGYCDVAVTGAIEWDIQPLVKAGYRSLGALSRVGCMRPFDRTRDGFVPAEGAGCLVLESSDHARARGAAPLGFLAGWSMGADATGPMTMSPEGDSIAVAIRHARARAGMPVIDYINAHGTATRLNDIIETRGIAQVFGDGIPVSSTKPLTGHLLGAAGAVEAVLCLKAMRESFIPPTLNLIDVDEECNLDYVPLVGRRANLRTVLSLSYGFGGHIAALVLQKDMEALSYNG